MSKVNSYDRACDLSGLLKAADTIAYEARTSDYAFSGLVSILSVAVRLSDEVCSDAEKAHDAQVRAHVEAIEEARAMLAEKVGAT